MKARFDAKPTESKRNICKDIIVKRISKIESIGDADIKTYVSRVMDNMTEEQLTDLEQSPELYAKKIRDKAPCRCTRPDSPGRSQFYMLHAV